MKEWDKEKEKRLKEYPKLNYRYEMSCIRRNGFCDIPLCNCGIDKQVFDYE